MGYCEANLEIFRNIYNVSIGNISVVVFTHNQKDLFEDNLAIKYNISFMAINIVALSFYCLSYSVAAASGR